MQNSILAATILLALLTGQKAIPPKPLPADVGPGRIAWFDITTSNMPQSKEFYGKLFDWTFAPVGGSELAVEIISRGVGIGTLRVAEVKIGNFNGVVYVQVTDIQASCRKATDLGGTVVPGFPFNLPDGRGAVAVLVDPAGHPIGMYSRTQIASEVSTGR
ncbi:MAG: glyoxalase [Acidobacteria bacterium]|nr:glyoxalase [Acidobacteriota bacterium]